MPKRLHERVRAAGSSDAGMFPIEAIVAVNDDPERQHRIKVIIPVIDETTVHDEWVRALVPWVGAAGFGHVGMPEVGSEVLLLGRLGERHNLFYAQMFNEDFLTPAEFSDGSRGFKNDRVTRLLGSLLFLISSQTQITVSAGSLVEADAPNVKLQSGGAVGVHAQGAHVGFLGASPSGRITLPGPATDLGSCIALANALRAALITFGLCQ